MEKFRRPGLSKVRLTVCALLCAFAWAAEAPHASLSLTTTGTPGSLVIANHSSKEILLMDTIKIEQKSGGHWVPVEADFHIISDCAQAAKVEKCFRLAAQTSMKVVPWTGFSCSGQCNQSCRANVKYSAGMYRFVLTSCADSGLHYSEAFELRVK